MKATDISKIHMNYINLGKGVGISYWLLDQCQPCFRLPIYTIILHFIITIVLRFTKYSWKFDSIIQWLYIAIFVGPEA